MFVHTKMKKVLGVGKATREIMNAAKSAGEYAMSAVFSSAKKGARRSAKSASPSDVNKKAVKAAKRTVRTLKNNM
jgi:hypothetical protein